MTVNWDCSSGARLVVQEAFVVGQPNTVTGTQTQTDASGRSCEFDIYGSTNLAAVKKSAERTSDAGASPTSDGASPTNHPIADISTLSTYSKPSPGDEAAVSGECAAMAQAELAACPSDTNDLAGAVNRCLTSWKRYDSGGCGAAWRAYAQCRATAALDCETRTAASCSAYESAYAACQSSFLQATGCSPAGSAATICAGGLGTYSYTCLGASAPFTDCTSTTTASALPYYCCY